MLPVLPSLTIVNISALDCHSLLATLMEIGADCVSNPSRPLDCISLLLFIIDYKASFG